MNDSSAFLTNLGCRENSSGLIIAKVSINGVKASIVIDTGASASFLPGEGVVVKDSNPILLTNYTDTRIANNGHLDCTHLTYCDITLEASKSHQAGVKFLIINSSDDILGYDGLIGTDLIKSFKVSIDSDEGLLVARVNGIIVGEEHRNRKCKEQLGATVQVQEPPSAPLDELLRGYSDIFAEIVTGPMKSRPMEILLTEREMPKARLRRYSVEDTAEIDRQVKSMLDRRVIEPSVSPYSSTCHLVPKKNGQKRLVINYKPLNEIAVQDHYPIPQISDLLAHLAGAKYFCALDCTEGFWQIVVSSEDRPKTAFVTPQGLYQFRRCPFGFTNSPAVFQRAMNEIFRDGLYVRCVIYIDDILVYGQTKEETLDNLEWVFKKCKENNVKLKLSKCIFMKEKVNFLGYQIGQGVISPIPDKHISWRDSQPSSIKEAQAFLGFMNYYSRFIESHSERVTCIRRAIKQKPFQWTEKCEAVRNELLDELKMATSQVIPLASTAKQVCLAVLDDSIEATCLSEDGQLIMRTGKTLPASQRNYSTLEKELLALVRAYDKFGPILKGPVTVKTSCMMLPQVLKRKEKPERVARFLLQLPPDAKFKVEAVNDVSEMVSRMIEPPEETFYTDGALKTRSDGKHLASWAVVAVNNPELNCSGVMKDGTNQKAELEAVIKACEIAETNGMKRILVVTDSKYAASACEKWIDNWEENGWMDNKNKPVKNKEAFERLSQAKKKLDLKIVHVRGHSGDKYNELADSMAREALMPHIESCAIIYSQPELKQNEDQESIDIKQKLLEGISVGNYYLEGGKLWIRQQDVNKLVVPKAQQTLLIQLAHNDPIYGAHYGVKKTRRKLEQYYWPGMGTNISEFVSSCELCQRNKASRRKSYGLFMPIKTSALFERVHLDIIGPVTTTVRGNKYIITGIDAFSRLGFARAYPAITANEIVEVLKEEVIYRHGPPANIVTDNGSQFTSILFENFLKNLDIKHATTCEYNPQSNGMDERFNATLVARIKSLLNQDKEGWDGVLQGAVLAYNLTPNDSSRLSPYTVVYGRLARSPLNPKEMEVELDEASHDEIRVQAAANSAISQERAAVQYNRSRRDCNLDPLDLVMVKTTGLRDSKKLAPKFTGPHCVLRLLEHDGEKKAVEILDSDTFKVRRVPFGAIKDYCCPSSSEQSTLPGDIIMATLGNKYPSPCAESTSNDQTPAVLVGSNDLPLAICGTNTNLTLQDSTERPQAIEQAQNNNVTEHAADQGLQTSASDPTVEQGQLLNVTNLERSVDEGQQPQNVQDQECTEGVGQISASGRPEGTDVLIADPASECVVVAGQATVDGRRDSTGQSAIGEASERVDGTGQVSASECTETVGPTDSSKIDINDNSSIPSPSDSESSAPTFSTLSCASPE